MELRPIKPIQVCAHWQGLKDPQLMGILNVSFSRGKEIFSFEYDEVWLKTHGQELDPDLALYAGPQYARDDHANFGIFLDSSPDRWGRVLMQRREAQLARSEKRPVKNLLESDFLLGVFDKHRMGALRFRLSEKGPFLDNNKDMASPPWAQLRDLEYASNQLEKDNAETQKDYMKWLHMLIAPGGSLGGARPKASVIDPAGNLWIAKFPSEMDEVNSGAWEYVLYLLAIDSGIEMAEAKIQQFSGRHHTFLTKRFDRTNNGERLHFASAMTLLGKKDGDDYLTGASYLDLVNFIIQKGAETNRDLEQLWRRIVFNIYVSNVDDHLRNHGFLLKQNGWILSPAFDMNPSATGNGLTLNISEVDNSQNLDLVMEVAAEFRIKKERAKEIIYTVKKSVNRWRKIAKKAGIKNSEIELMQNAFRLTID